MYYQRHTSSHRVSTLFACPLVAGAPQTGQTHHGEDSLLPTVPSPSWRPFNRPLNTSSSWSRKWSERRYSQQSLGKGAHGRTSPLRPAKGERQEQGPSSHRLVRVEPLAAAPGRAVTTILAPSSPEGIQSVRAPSRPPSRHCCHASDKGVPTGGAGAHTELVEQVVTWAASTPPISVHASTEKRDPRNARSSVLGVSSSVHSGATDT